MDKEKFDKQKYDKEYIKKNKSKFAVDLNKFELEELNLLLGELNLTKASFLRNAIKDLKQKKEDIN